MTWDLATAKDRLGISETAKDVQLQAQMDIALAAIESALSRRLMHETDIAETIKCMGARTLLLSRYPVTQITSLENAKGIGSLPEYTLRAASGIVYFDTPVVVDFFDVVYDGGYQTLPADLEEAMWQAFEWLWNASLAGQDGLARVPGSGSGDATRVTVQDFGSVTLDTGIVGGSGPGMNRLVNAQLDWGWLLPWSSVLMRYRSDSGPSGGIA